MNMHVPQSVGTAVELQEIASVKRQILSPGTGKPVIYLLQDALLGMSMFAQQPPPRSGGGGDDEETKEEEGADEEETKEEDGGGVAAGVAGVDRSVRMNRNAAMDLLAWCPLFEGFDRTPAEGTEYTGHGLLMEHMLPFLRERRYVRPFSSLGRPPESGKKNAFKSCMKAVVRATFVDDGPDATRDLLDATNFVAMRWLLARGFSVGLRDLFVKPEVLTEMHQARKEAKRKVIDIICKVHDGTLQNKTSATDEDYFEQEVQRSLCESLNKMNKVAMNPQSIDPAKNRLLRMIDAGSKGSALNFSQMVAMVGQQSVGGKRVAYGFTERTLPHFHKYDDGVRARGFCSSSYVDGLDPTEFFFHAIAGREGLIDTAVKSVARGTRLLVLEGGRPRVVAIGDWVDAHLARRAAQVKHHGPEEANMELLAVPGVRVLSNDARGNVGWHALTAVTRHDPGEHIYQVRTRWGREVEVVASETLLVWDDASGEFVPRNTPDVAVGDRVPVAVRTPAPSPPVGSVDLAEFLPRTAYIHGTDYQRAWAMRSAALEGGGRLKVPAGWWEAHIGRDFVLPYASGVQFHRSYERSGGADIRPGCVYIYGAKRSAAHVPASFVLDEDNGFFLGLFLADGNACGDYVAFAQNHAPTRRRVAAWFDRHGVTHHTTTRGSTTIRGSCTLLSRFLTAFVGKGAAGKHVPAAAFAAPEPFVRGLLDGYFSGDGHVGPNCIEAGSASRALTQGVARLLARFGIFAALSVVRPKPSPACAAPKASHRLRVASRYARRFATELRLTHEGKQAALDALATSPSLEKCAGIYVEKGDAVLDEIVSIRRVRADSDARYRKVYDVTVPGTLNFELFDGLCVRDTAETGYIQRRMVKAMEDLVVAEDGTVRNVVGRIVQVHYGGDGFDVTKLTGFRVPDWAFFYLERERGDAAAAAADVPAAWRTVHALEERLGGGGDTPPLTPLRDVAAGLGALVDDDQKLHTPLSLASDLQRIMREKSRSRAVPGADDEVSNESIVRTGLDLWGRIQKCGREDLWLRDVDRNRSIEATVRFFFTPACLAALLREETDLLRKSDLEALCDRVVAKLRDARAVPGEPVGIIAAQSLGEPATQMSARADTPVVVRVDGRIQRTAIGPLVDSILGSDCQGEAVRPCRGLVCVGVTDRERVAWADVTHVSRHPANGPMLSVATKHGRRLDMTASHSFLVRRNNRVVPMPGSELVLGDSLPVVKTLPRGEPDTASPPFRLTGAVGRFLGAVLAEGYVNERTVSFCGTELDWVADVAHEFEADTGLTCYVRDRVPSPQSLGTKKQAQASVHNTRFALHVSNAFGKTSHSKSIPGWVLGAPDEFVCAFLRAYFDGDGSVCANGTHKRLCCHSVSSPLIDMLSLCLARFGIPSYIGTEAYTSCRPLPSGESAYVTPAGNHGTIHRLRVPVSAAGLFERHIGFGIARKKRGLRDLVMQPDTGGREQIPGMSGVLASLRNCVDDAGTRKEIARVVRRGNGVTLAMLRRLRTAAVTHGAPEALVSEIDQAVAADVWWDPIVEIRTYTTGEMVYDFTVDQTLQSFMLGNGVFVHNTLNTFHSAGVSEKSNVIRGVPRLKEILRVTSNMQAPSMTVYPKTTTDGGCDDKECADRLRNTLRQTRLADILTHSEIVYEPGQSPPEDLRNLGIYQILQDKLTAATTPPPPPSAASSAATARPTWVLCLAFDSHRMLLRGINMIDVYQAVSQMVAKSFNTSADNNHLAMTLREDAGGAIGGFVGLRISYQFAAGMQDDDDDITDEDVLMLLQKMETDLVARVSIGGVSGIRGGVLRQVEAATPSQRARLEKDTAKFVVDTDGANLAIVLGLPAVDARLTVSNDIKETLEVLGIEAARSTIISEFRDVVKSAETFVNDHHIGLLADAMTYTGYIVAVNRHGINRNPDNSILGRASFEMTPETLLEAAVFGAHDNMRGVSASVMFGQPTTTVGTGVVDLIAEEPLPEVRPVCKKQSYRPGAWDTLCIPTF